MQLLQTGITTITITRTDDWHLHLRDDDMLGGGVIIAAAQLYFLP